MKISLIAAMAQNRVIGRGLDIPWKIPGEQLLFKRLTESKVLVMGRKTFDSLRQPLPNRTTIVVTRKENYAIGGCLAAPSYEAALNIARDLASEVFVAGGAEIYRSALPGAHTIHLTTISQPFDGDVFFPEIPAEFSVTYSQEIAASIPYRYEVYERSNL